jgi:acetolactate decarboxylase
MAACALTVLAALLCGCGADLESRETLYQVSTLKALAEGVRDGETPVRELLRRGDFGIGTFNGMDGEMVLVEDRCYQVRADGTVAVAEGDRQTPFAAVTFFEARRLSVLKEDSDLAALGKRLDALLAGPNLPHAVCVSGDFSYLKLRSVARQRKPYPPMAEVIRTQSVYELKDARGILVGFYMPQYLEGVNLPGYHFHFLSEDRRRGGHVLACRGKDLLLALAPIPRLHLALPKEGEFLKADLRVRDGAELQKAMQDPAPEIQKR